MRYAPYRGQVIVVAFSVDTGPRFNAKIADGNMARVLVAHIMYHYPLLFDYD